jgi:NACHT domain
MTYRSIVDHLVILACRLEKIMNPARELFAASQRVLDAWADFVSSYSETKCSSSWFWKSPEYQSWRESDDSQFLRCSAKPGAGKSTIAETLVSELKPQRIHSESIAHFFFQLPLKTRASPCKPELVVCSIISQLLYTRYHQTAIHDKAAWLSHNEHAILQKALESAVQDSCTLDEERIARPTYVIDEKASISPTFSSAMHSTSSDDLWKILASLICASTGQYIHIVVDGVDESLPEDQSRLCKNLRDLWKSVRARGDPTLKILITSRPLSRIQDLLTGLSYIDQDKEQMGKKRFNHAERALIYPHRMLRILKTGILQPPTKSSG